MEVTATPDLLSFVEANGGSLFVRCRKRLLARGVTFLRASTKEPHSLAGYEVFVVDRVFVLTHLPARSRPNELHLSLEGRRRKRPTASWDGCAFVV